MEDVGMYKYFLFFGEDYTYKTVNILDISEHYIYPLQYKEHTQTQESKKLNMYNRYINENKI